MGKWLLWSHSCTTARVYLVGLDLDVQDFGVTILSKFSFSKAIMLLDYVFLDKIVG